MLPMLCGKNGRRSLTPGTYFCSLVIGYFEGIDSERGIAWRVADSLALRQLLQIGLDESTPDHSTISRTRRLIDVETHRKVFGCVSGLLADRGLLKGKMVAIDATTLEANTAMRSIIRPDKGQAFSAPEVRIAGAVLGFDYHDEGEAEPTMFERTVAREDAADLGHRPLPPMAALRAAVDGGTMPLIRKYTAMLP